VFWKFYEKKKTLEGEEFKERFPILRYYNVFNVTQCTWPDESVWDAEEREFNPIEDCENVIEGYTDCPETIHVEATIPSYNPSLDRIKMPKKEQFKSDEEYYSTRFHEMNHSTGHKKRLDRKGVGIGFKGDSIYSEEEIIAEMATAYLCAEAGILHATKENNAAYIKSWLQGLKEDKKFIFKVSSQAQKSTDYILGRKYGDDGK